jgi:proline racemase
VPFLPLQFSRFHAKIQKLDDFAKICLIFNHIRGKSEVSGMKIFALSREDPKHKDLREVRP